MQFCRWLNNRYKGSGFRRNVVIAAVMATVHVHDLEKHKSSVLGR